MIVILAHTPDPSALDTVEALCDAILRDDNKTQKTLMTVSSVPETIKNALALVNDNHNEVATSYKGKVEKEWDSSTASYVIVSIPLNDKNESIKFECRKIVNQWEIISMSLEAPKNSIN